MYPTSNDYKIAISKNARAHKLRGKIDGHDFEGKNIIKNSFSYRNQFCPATAIQLGGVYIGELDLTFSDAYASSLNIRGEWRGKIITVEQGVEAIVGGEQTFIYIPIGVFTIEDAKWTDVGIQIVAYDNMGKFDKTFPADTTGGFIYDFMSYACVQCGVPMGMTAEEVAALPNGNEALGLYLDNTIQTFRDLLAFVATAAGCFCTISRTGALVLRRLPDTSVLNDTVPAKMRYSTSFSDFESFYSEMKMQDLVNDQYLIYENDNVYGLQMDIGANPLLQYGTTETKDRQRQAVIDAIEPFRAVPFKVSMMPNPAYDLGDVIKFAGGYGLNSVGVIMSITMKESSLTIEGYGENPAAAGAQSALSKEVAAQGQETKDLLVIHTYENSKAYSLANHHRETVISIDFTTMRPTTVVTHSEVNFDLDIEDESGEASVTVYYYLNGQLLTYKPVETYTNSGKHNISLMLPLKSLEAGSMYEWRVAIEADGGSVSIDRGSIHAVLEGQGLVALDQFDGSLILTDTYICAKNSKKFAEWQDIVECDEWPFDENVISDTYITATSAKNFASWTDELIITQWLGPAEELITESGDDLVTEDGEQLLTEGERYI